MNNIILIKFLVRWIGNSFGLWISAQILPAIVLEDNYAVALWAGLALSVVNTLVKPLLILLSLSAIIFTFGLFLIVVNVLMIYLASAIVDDLKVNSFWQAMVAAIIIGVVNYAVTSLFEYQRSLKES